MSGEKGSFLAPVHDSYPTGPCLPGDFLITALHDPRAQRTLKGELVGPLPASVPVVRASHCLLRQSHISVMFIHLFLKLLGESNHFVVFPREQKGVSLSPKVASVYLFKISMPVGQLF